MNITKINIGYKTRGAPFQFLMINNIPSFVNIVLANSYIFHDVQI